MTPIENDLFCLPPTPHHHPHPDSGSIWASQALQALTSSIAIGIDWHRPSDALRVAIFPPPAVEAAAQLTNNNGIPATTTNDNL